MNMTGDLFYSHAAQAIPALAGLQVGLGIFDIAVVILLLLGIWQGRKQGMSRELLPTIQWAGTVALGAILYKPLGSLLARTSGFSLLWSYLSAYFICMSAVSIVMGYAKRAAGEKMTDNETFGNMEYYLGMLMGPIRYACVLMTALALMHAPYYTDAEIEAKRKAQIKELGSEFFPSLGGLQRYIFRDSILGSSLEKHTPFLLIESTSSSGVAAPKETLKERHQKELDDPIK